MIVAWQDLTAAELNARAKQGAIVLLPVASTEQHGPHLATGVDGYLCGEVCRRAALRVVAGGRAAVVAPTLWPGLAEHHVPFGGTFTLSLSTWHAVLRDLVRSIHRAGFQHIVLVNGHGGNIAALNALNVELTQELGVPVATTTYFQLVEDMAAVLEDQSEVMHACEAETSMMMAAFPDRVRDGELSKAFGPHMGVRGALARPILKWKPFTELTPTGVVGDARRATAAKGEVLLEACATALADRLLAGEPWA